MNSVTSAVMDSTRTQTFPHATTLEFSHATTLEFSRATTLEFPHASTLEFALDGGKAPYLLNAPLVPELVDVLDRLG